MRRHRHERDAELGGQGRRRRRPEALQQESRANCGPSVPSAASSRATTRSARCAARQVQEAVGRDWHAAIVRLDVSRFRDTFSGCSERSPSRSRSPRRHRSPVRPRRPPADAPASPIRRTRCRAAGRGSLWLACRERGTVVRFDDRRGIAGKTVKTPGTRPWAVAADRRALGDRPEPAAAPEDRHADRQAAPRRARKPAGRDLGRRRLGLGRLRTGQRRRAHRPEDHCGSGCCAPATARPDSETDGKSVWIACHRDNSIARVDLATGRVTTIAEEVAEPQTTAAERIAYAQGSLWVTGRGLDLLRLDATTGHVQATSRSAPPASTSCTSAAASSSRPPRRRARDEETLS